MALSDCSHQVVWIHSLLSELGYPQPTTTIAGDNQGSIFMAENPVTEAKSKHIDIRYHYIRQVIAKQQVLVEFIDGTENPADMLTKNLGHVKFLQFRGQLGLEFYSSN